jgi:hypothetical protein
MKGFAIPNNYRGLQIPGQQPLQSTQRVRHQILAAEREVRRFNGPQPLALAADQLQQTVSGHRGQG